MAPRKREIRKFHFVIMQRRQSNVQKSVMYVQSCRFAYLNLLLLCRSRCHRHRRCLRCLVSFVKRVSREGQIKDQDVTLTLPKRQVILISEELLP